MRSLLFIALIFTFSPAFSQHPQNNNTSDHPYGDFGLSLHSIQMLREYSLPSSLSDVRLDAGSMAANFSYNYSSSNFEAGLEYITAFKQFSNSNDGRIKANYALSINEYNVLNQLFVGYSFGGEPDNSSYLRVGRQVLNLNFVTPNKLRHKDQAFEAAVIRFSPISSAKVTIGHLEKYSTWSSRTFIDGQEIKNKFVDVAQAEASESGNGIQFIDSEWTFGNHLKLQLYDYYWKGLYNTAGLNADYKIDVGNWATTFSGRMIQQEDTDNALNKVSSEGYQIHASIKDNHWLLETGIFITSGKGEQSRIRSPFAVNLAFEKPLFETGLAPIGGSKSAYFDGTFHAGKHSISSLVFYTDVYEEGYGSSSKELDLIYALSLTESLTLKFKFAHVRQRLTNRNYSINDHRLFVDYVF